MRFGHIPLQGGLKLQVLQRITDLSRCQKHHFAAFVIEPPVLVVWEDDPNNIISRVDRLESDIVSLVWKVDDDDDEKEASKETKEYYGDEKRRRDPGDETGAAHESNYGGVVSYTRNRLPRPELEGPRTRGSVGWLLFQAFSPGCISIQLFVSLVSCRRPNDPIHTIPRAELIY